MKTFLSILCCFILGSVAGTVAASSIYMIFCSLMTFTAGVQHGFFSSYFFINGVFISIPLIISAALVSIVLLGIRRPSNPVIRNSTYISLGLLTWLVLIPLNFELKEKYNMNAGYRLSETVQTVPSQGYFRPAKGGSVYISRIRDDMTADGIFIDIEGISGKQGAVIPFSNEKTDYEDGGYADVLIKDYLEMSPLVSIPCSVYMKLFDRAESEWHKGIISWLFFATFGLALISAAGAGRICTWKLINVIAVIVSITAIVIINTYDFSGKLNVNIPVLNLCMAAVLFASGFIIPVLKSRRQE